MAVSQIPAAPVVALMGFGVVVAVLGHMTKLRGVVALGITILFVATGAMLVGGFVAYHDDPADPRPKSDPASPGF
jgi:uncharacterized membrane protein